MQKLMLAAVLLFMALGHCSAQVVTHEQRSSGAVSDTAPARAVYRNKDPRRAEKEAIRAERDAIVRRVVLSTNIALWAPSLKIEGRVSPYVSVGGIVKARLTYFTGGKIDPFVRWYPRGHAPRGFFAQLKGSAGMYHTKILGQTFWSRYRVGVNSELPNTVFQAYGGGITAGYQMLVGHERRGAIEFFGGFQYIYYTIPITSDFLVQKLAIMMPLELGIRFGGAF